MRRSHTICAPRTALRANLEGMLAGVVPPDAERIATLDGEVGRLIRLVEDLLTLASARAGALPLVRRPTDLVAVTRDRPVRTAGGGQGAVADHDDPPRGTGLVDPDRVDAVLTNLVVNAVRHMPPGGRIEVALRLDGEVAEWTVTDDGPGIPPDILPHVTEPFVRGDPARGRPAGSGLGLAIAETWVKAHGGTLHIASDHGTRIVVRLPCSAAGG